MKILHTSDLHIGSPLTSRLSPEKVRERKAELLASFERMIEEAVYQRVSVFIIAGDLFDTEKITGSTAERVIGAMARRPSLQFLYLPGNHEKNALTESGISLPENLRLFGEEWTYFDYGDVCIAGRSRIAEGMFDSLNLSYAKTNIAVLHGALADGKSGGEIIGKRELEGKHVDYLALGHYHSYSVEKIFDTGVAVYSGTPEGRGFDEVGDKGYVLISTDGSRILHSFRSFAKRRLHIVPVELDGAVRSSDISERAERALKSIPCGDIVRLELCGRYFPTLWKDIDALTRQFENRFYYFEIKDTSRIAINPEDYKHDMSLKGEFIRTVSADSTLDEETKEKIIACGINALMGEDLFEN